MPGNYSKITTVVTGGTILASDRNAEHDNHITNMTPAGVDDYSTNATQMQSTTDPYPSSSESLPTSLAGELERLRYVIKQMSGKSQWYVDAAAPGSKGADVASASALPVLTDGNFFDVTGTTAITSINTLGVGSVIRLQFDGSLVLTHHATDLILPNGVNITTLAGDVATFVEYASGDWIMADYSRPPTFPKSFQARLTLTSATPVTSSDVTAATTIYLTPYGGDQIALYNGTQWGLHTLTEISIAVPATTVTMYDLFVYNNSGTLTLEATAWTNDTTRATALALQNGVYCKTGALTRRYVGSFRTTGSSGQTEDSLAKRFLWNYYNRVVRPMQVTDSTDSWTYTSAAYRQANNSAANQLDFIIGVGENAVTARMLHQSQSDTGNIQRSAAIGLDSTTVASGLWSVFDGPTANLKYFHQASYTGFPGIGRHFLAWLEYSQASGTTTWYGDAGGTTTKTGIQGELQG